MNGCLVSQKSFHFLVTEENVNKGWIELIGIIQLVWSLIAITLNLISFRILMSRDFANTCNRLIAILVMSDNFHIICSFGLIIFTLIENHDLIR